MTIFVSRNANGVRAGFTAGKKVGNAVKRNRARRLLREIFRKNRHRIHDGCVIVAMAQPEAIHNTLRSSEIEFLSLLKRAGLLL
jgi:ribonuclease P protein component